jgi:Subtilase family
LATAFLACPAAYSDPKVQYDAAAKPIVDEQGRKRIIIDFLDNAKERYSADADRAPDEKQSAKHPQVARLIDDYEKRLGFKSIVTTTWVGASATAYLSIDQIEKLKRDSSVAMLTEDRYAEFSAAWSAPPWYPSWNGSAWGELKDWAHTAVNGKSVANVSGGTVRKIYVIDSGVAYHADLGSVSERVNVACGSVDLGTECSSRPAGGGGHVGYYAKVGCFAHATHVAGIIGATSSNGQNRMGVYAGANIVSIGLLQSSGTINGVPAGPWVPCGDSGLTVSSIGAAFDFIYERNSYQQSFGMRPNIVNLSANSVGVGFNPNGTAQTNRAKLAAMVNPSYVWRYTSNGWLQIYYSGALFVQSAGNDNKNSCSLFARGDGSAAYMTSSTATVTNSSDGIMVVGAVNSSGLPAIPWTATEPRGLTGPEAGTNFGNCIDI